jgi:hypothetical protein
MRVVRRFLRFAGKERPDRLGDDTVRAFFQGLPVRSRRQFAGGCLAVLDIRRGALRRISEGKTAYDSQAGRCKAGKASEKAVKDASELALRQTWAVDRLVEKQQTGDNLIVLHETHNRPRR